MISETLSNPRADSRDNFDALVETGEKRKHAKFAETKFTPSSQLNRFLVPGVSQEVIKSEKNIESMTLQHNSIFSTKRV